MTDKEDPKRVRSAPKEVPKEEEEELTFEEIMKRNKENEERLKKERLTNNKSTLRSYRIKP